MFYGIKIEVKLYSKLNKKSLSKHNIDYKKSVYLPISNK